MGPAGVPGPIDPMTTRLVVHRGDDAEGQAATRATREGPPGKPPIAQRVFAWVGVVTGFLFLIVPGLWMMGRVRAWRQGEVPTPGLAGPLGALVLWGAAAAGLWAAGWGIVAVVVFVVVGLPSAAFATRS